MMVLILFRKGKERDRVIRGTLGTVIKEWQKERAFPGSPVVRNLPASAGVSGSIPGLGTKILHAMGKLNSCPQLLSMRPRAWETDC